MKTADLPLRSPRWIPCRSKFLFRFTALNEIGVEASKKLSVPRSSCSLVIDSRTKRANGRRTIDTAEEGCVHTWLLFLFLFFRRVIRSRCTAFFLGFLHLGAQDRPQQNELGVTKKKYRYPIKHPLT